MLIGFINLFVINSLIIYLFIYLKFYFIEIKFMCVVFNIPSHVYN